MLYVVDAAHLPWSASLDPIVLSALIGAAGYAIALFGFHILDPVPAARRVVIEQMHAGMVVFDAKWHVVSLNPAAERITGIRAGAARGKTWQQLRAQGALLPTLPDDGTQPAEVEIELPEMALGSGASARQYAPALSALRDFRGLLTGYLLMLRDVTEPERAQARLMEQQQVMATLRERERLARELHDGLAQSFAAAHLQASTAKLSLTRGATAEVAECLDDILDTTLQAETDARDYLLAARSVIAPGRTFFPALREHLQRFTRQYGLPVELSVPPELEEHGLAPAVEVQLLRIIQEALSNVRKHACANHVQVCFGVAERQLRVAIIDDGRGFDPATLASAGDGYGLRAMRERAEALGGSLTVSSRASQGTEVVALLPLEH
jgi:signal transduction histidine kinase